MAWIGIALAVSSAGFADEVSSYVAFEQAIAIEADAITLLGGSPNLEISSCCQDPLNQSITNCHFDRAVDNNGVNVRIFYRLTVTFRQCSANRNDFDGFNVHNLSGAQSKAFIYLEDCEANRNDPNGLGSPRGDGVTAHGFNQTIEVIGGRFLDNGKSGAAMTYSSDLSVRGAAHFERNGWANGLGDVYVSDYGRLYWYDGRADSLVIDGAGKFYGGRIEHVDVIRGRMEVYGIAIAGYPAEGFDDCLRPILIGCDDYFAYSIPIPGDTNGDHFISAAEGLAELTTPSTAPECETLLAVRLASMQQLVVLP